MRVILLAWFFSLQASFSFSQAEFNYIWPIDSPFVITANYGELRPNHFHTGLDFSTGGKINLPVYSIQEGYVSRIRISQGGYGKCVYITHPDGNVSVYGHLNAFSLKVDKAAKEYQLAVHSYEIDFLLRPKTVYVRRNEIIGLSGNTGSSTGPHLHFELRDQLSEVPLNPLQYYRINDHTPPVIQQLGVYDLADTSAPKLIANIKVKQGNQDSLYLDNDHIVLDNAIVGMAFSGLDKFTLSGSSNNIFSAKLFYEDFMIYSHKLSGIPFSEAAYINEFCETSGSGKLQKCFLPTLYPSEMYDKCFDKGRILLIDTLFHKLNLVVMDESGNEKNLQFYIRTKKFNYYKEPAPRAELYVNCNESFSGSQNSLQVYLPAKSLFYSTSISLENTIETSGKLTIAPLINLRQPITVAFKVPDKFKSYAARLILKNGNELSTAIARNDSVLFSIKNSGTYQLIIDVVAPKVKVDYSAKRLKNAWEMESFSFVISDDLSGIASYNVWLNQAWVLAEYDNKKDLLTYYFDEDTPFGLLQFKVEVKDRSGNETVLDYVLKK
jgi:hypothetical protein